MDALLSSIGQSVRAESSNNGNVCNTIQDVCQSLTSYVARRTDTRAEHISTTFEIRRNAVFDIAVEPEVPEGEDPVHHLQLPVTRTINASETIMNQPTDDPVPQRIVAKHIIGAIGEVDGSSWNVRQVVRGAQGWDFTYQCKNSLQAWNCQNAKTPGRPPIAAWSGPGGQDSINMSRPAFDCRGSVSITFSRTNRAIVIKYEHTPLHKTVAELADLLAPAVPPPPVANGNHIGNKSTKAKRPPPAEGEEGAPKKRAKRKGKAADNIESNQADPDRANTSAQNQSNQGQDSASAGTTSATPFLNIPAAEAARRRELAVELLSGKGIDPTTLSEEQMNIFSNQAPHLQELSLEMLAKYGAERLRIVHPDEKDQQVSTNTTPAQGTPDIADASASGPAAAPPGDTDTPTKKRKPRKRKSDAAAENGDGTPASRAVEPGNAQNGGMETTTLTLNLPKQRRTRGTCDTCKNRKLKCTKEHPVCSVCQEAGETCVYLPPRPRRKSEKSIEKSAETVDHDTDAQAEEEEDSGEKEQIEHPEHVEPPLNVQPVQITPVPVPRPMQAVQQISSPATAAPVLAMDPDNDEFIPDPNILSGPIEQPQPAAPQSMNTNYYSSNSGVTYSDADSSEAARHAHQAMANLTFPSSQFQRDTSQASPSLSFPSATQPSQPPSAYSQPPPVAQHQPARQNSRSTNRRSLPTGPVTQHQRADSGNTAASLGRQSGWNNASHSPDLTAQDTNRSPSFSQAQAAKQRPRSRKSGYEAQVHAHPSPDTMQAAVTLSQTATQQQTPHVSAVTRSPYQTTRKPAARTQSRQGHRSQTNTPVTQTPVPPPQLPTSFNTAPNAYSNTSVPTTAPGYDTYSRYNTSNTQYPNTTTAGDPTAQSSYEPNSYQTHSTSTATDSYATPSYDYSRNSGTGDTNTVNDTSNYGAASSSNSNQWTSSQGRGSRSDATHSYNMPNTQPAPTSPYGTRSAARQASQATYNQSQQPGYSSYQSQSANQPHQSQTNQAWYGFPAASTNNSNHAGYNSNTANATYGSTSASTNAGAYSSHRPNMAGYGSSYSEEPSIFDLLSRGHSGN